jgi:hypothetical protein
MLICSTNLGSRRGLRLDEEASESRFSFLGFCSLEKEHKRSLLKDKFSEGTLKM